MRRSYRSALALTAVAALLVTGCGDDQDAGDAADEQPTDGADGTGTPADGEDPLGQDPNDDIEDGVYRGSGVVLPVPEGWTLEPQALAQGTVAAVSADRGQQLTAQAVDTAQAEAAGRPLDYETMLDEVRQQAGQEGDIDEEIELDGAERAHRLTFLDLAPPQEGLPPLSATIVIAEDGDGVLGQFVYSARSDAYDEATAELLLEEAGFDPDSEPPAPQQPQPGPTSSE